MNHRRLFRICLLPVAGALALLLQPGAHAAGAADPGSLVASKLDGGTILNSPAPKLISAVGDSVHENPKLAPAIVTVTLTSGRTDADAIAPKVTVAAIEGLGSNPSPAAVAAIISASVKAAPAVVLETVKESAKAAPKCADAIVLAALQAVPDPKAKIETVSDTAPTVRGYSKDDSKETADPEEQLLPIAEAIAQAAYQGDPSLSYPDLLNLVEHPPTTFTNTSVYPGYYYPPIVQIVTGTTPTAMPTPPVVSK